MNFDLRAALDAYDGVHTEALEKIAATLPSDKRILRGLCDLALHDESKLQSASTWLLKRFSERGVTFNNEQTRMLLDVLLRKSYWEAKLHVLQMLDNLTIPAEEVPPLWTRLREMSADVNKLIRAWSYHGIAALAEQHPSYRVEAMCWLKRGEGDEAASVRARIRRLRNTFGWLRSDRL